jgi:hypothetical protein
LALICLLGAIPAQAADNVIRYYPSGSIYTYRWALLKLALDHVEKLDHRHYELVPLNDKVTQWRAEQLLSSGKVDVVAFAPNAQREKLLQPVRWTSSRASSVTGCFLCARKMPPALPA